MDKGLNTCGTGLFCRKVNKVLDNSRHACICSLRKYVTTLPKSQFQLTKKLLNNKRCKKIFCIIVYASSAHFKLLPKDF